VARCEGRAESVIVILMPIFSLRTGIIFVLLAALPALPLPAQWIHLPSKETPHTADGKPDLTAPARRTAAGHPDLEGIWQVEMKYLTNVAADLKDGEVPFQPASKKIFDARQNDGFDAKNDPAARCIPGMPKLNALPYPFKIVDTPKEVIILYEGFTTFRQVHMDGRGLPKDPNASWIGYSVGRWEKDALVVDTIGINETTWMDNAGHPHSDALHVTERFRRVDFGHLDIDMTFDDPKTYTKPWTITEHARIVPDSELLEYICTENNRGYEHLQ
jgi:hypothetical protein